MRSRKIVFALFGLAMVSCDDGDVSKAAVKSCALDLVVSPDGTPILTGDCTRDAEGIAAAIARASDILKSAEEIAVGRTKFGPAGVFDHCAVLARLADDPRWTASIDSNKAGVPLRDALQSDTLAPPISAALAKAGRKLRGVSSETILLTDDPVSVCPKRPVITPVEAQIWLKLD